MSKSKRKRKKQIKMKLNDRSQSNDQSFFSLSDGGDNGYKLFKDIFGNAPDDCKSGYTEQKEKSTIDLLEWLWHNLPVLEYVVGSIVNLIFSAPLVSGSDEDENEKIKEFLYSQNAQGTTNYLLIRQAVKYSLVFGRAGIRFLSEDDGLQLIKYNRYGTLVAENTEYYGFDDLLAYIISRDKQKLDFSTVEKDKIDGWLNFDLKTLMRKGILITEDKRHIGVPVEDFINLRTDVSLIEGEPILTHDQLRVRLITTIYETLVKDLEYDGPGRLLFWLNNGIDRSGGNEASTSDVLNTTVRANQNIADNAKEEATELGKKIKNSSSDSVVLVSDMFEKMEHIPRVTKSTEFLTFSQDAGEIIAQVFGINPALIGLGKMSGNVSMEKVLENAMQNVIIPYRELFAVQLSNILAPKIGVEKMYFYKDDSVDSNAKTENALKIVELAEKLKALGQDEKANALLENIII